MSGSRSSRIGRGCSGITRPSSGFTVISPANGNQLSAMSSSKGRQPPILAPPLMFGMAAYAGAMLWFLILLAVVAVAAYKFRVPIMARLLGQSESRVQRALDKKKRS